MQPLRLATERELLRRFVDSNDDFAVLKIEQATRGN
jgi:hypothetical protein